MLGKILEKNNIIQEYFNKNSLSPHKDEKNTSTKILWVPIRTTTIFQLESSKSTKGTKKMLPQIKTNNENTNKYTTYKRVQIVQKASKPGEHPDISCPVA